MSFFLNNCTHSGFFLFVEPVVDDLPAVSGDDGFGVKLQSVDRKVFMIEGHDVSFFVQRTGLKAGRQAGGVYDPGMVTTDLYAGGYLPE